MRITTAVLALLLALPAQAVTMYRWVDAQGRPQFSDQPPPSGIRKFEAIEVRTIAPGEGGGLPYATQVAARNFPVTLYSSACGSACTAAKNLLVKRGIPFTEKDADKPATQEELKKMLGGDLEVPVLKVGNSLVRGYEETDWHNALDFAGYPKIAGAPPPKPAPKAPEPAEAPVEGAPGEPPAPAEQPAPAPAAQ